MLCGKVLILCSCLLLVTSVAAAQVQQAPGEKDSNPEKAQRPELLSGSSPTKGAEASSEFEKGQQDLEALKKNPDEFRVLVLGVQIFLGRFGYGTGPYTGTFDEKTRSALREYQEYVGLPVNGDIDYRTVKHLTEDNKALDQPLPFLPQVSFEDAQWEKEVHAGGTWVLDGDTAVDSFRTSRISCYQAIKRCIESIASLSGDHTPTLSVQTHLYEIGAWDDSDLVTKPSEQVPCGSTILRIQRTKKVVTRLTSLSEGPGSCANVRGQDFHYHLIDGSQIYWSLKQQKAEVTKRILRVQ